FLDQRLIGARERRFPHRARSFVTPWIGGVRGRAARFAEAVDAVVVARALIEINQPGDGLVAAEVLEDLLFVLFDLVARLDGHARLDQLVRARDGRLAQRLAGRIDRDLLDRQLDRFWMAGLFES